MYIYIYRERERERERERKSINTTSTHILWENTNPFSLDQNTKGCFIHHPTDCATEDEKVGSSTKFRQEVGIKAKSHFLQKHKLTNDNKYLELPQVLGRFSYYFFSINMTAVTVKRKRRSQFRMRTSEIRKIIILLWGGGMGWVGIIISI